MLVMLPRILMLVRSELPLKAELPTLVTLDGSVMLVRLLPTNASAPMLTTPSGIVMLVNAVTVLKAPFPMLWTVAGIVTSAR